MTSQGEDIGPSRTHPENHQKRYVADVKQFTAKPVVNVGRFTNPDTMVAILAAGSATSSAAPGRR